MDQVDGDTLDGLWKGITKGEPFTVCYDELFSLCYDVPGWKSWSLALGLVELLFWSHSRFNVPTTTTTHP